MLRRNESLLYFLPPVLRRAPALRPAAAAPFDGSGGSGAAAPAPALLSLTVAAGAGGEDAGAPITRRPPMPELMIALLVTLLALPLLLLLSACC